MYAFLLTFFLYSFIRTYLTPKNILKFIGFSFDESLDIYNLPSKLIIISSHTSIYDFFIGLLFYYTCLYKRYSANLVMKYTFEKYVSFLFNYIDKKFKLIGVYPKKGGLTTQICNNLKNKDDFILFLAPEGTRKYTETIHKGYWVIAKELDIHIIYLGIDFDKKSIAIEPFRKIKKEWEDEQTEFINSCKKYTPLYPERCHWTKDFY